MTEFYFLKTNSDGKKEYKKVSFMKLRKNLEAEKFNTENLPDGVWYIKKYPSSKSYTLISKLEETDKLYPLIELYNYREQAIRDLVKKSESLNNRISYTEIVDTILDSISEQQRNNWNNEDIEYIDQL